MNNRTSENPFPRIGKPALRALANAGIRDLEALAALTEAELASLHGVGPKAVGLLRDAMASKGLKFRGAK